MIHVVCENKETELLVHVAHTTSIWRTPPPPPQVTGELLDEAMERMLLTDPHSADCLFRMRCEVPG